MSVSKTAAMVGSRIRGSSLRGKFPWLLFTAYKVEILVGKDKGKIGVVNSIIKERNWVYVEGLNCTFREIPRGDNTPPMCQRVESPLLINKQVKLVDPTDNKGTEIEWRYTEEGDRVRVSLRTGRIIPLPHGFHMGDDLVIPALYVETSKDTKEKELTKVTFDPKVITFEEEIMQSMGITEDRKPAKTFWY